MAASESQQTLIIKANLQRWIKAFIIDRKTMQVSKNTINFYNVEFRRFLAFCEDKNIQRLEEVTAENLREYLIHLQDTGRNPGGVNAGYRALKSLFLWYEEEAEPEGWKNPVKKVKMPRVAVEPLIPVSIEAVHKLIEVCEGDNLLDLRDRALFMFLLDSGLRAFELCALDLEDVDLLGGEALIRKGKGGKPRMVCFGKKSRRALRAYLKKRSDDCEALWVTINETRLTYWGLNQILKRRAKQAGIEKPGLHDFRRAFALNCLRGGMDIYSLQKLMGHADLQVLRRYLAQSDDDIREAYAKASPVDKSGL